jgi:hypothetical protein
MDLYSRTGLFIGPFHELMAWATGITGHVSDLIGSEVACWSVMFGAPAGTLGWSLPVDGVGGVAANNEKMIGDAKYHEMVAEGRQYSQPGSVEDALMNLAHGELTDQRPPIGAVATITTVTMQGRWPEAMAWGAEMAQLHEEIIGTPILFGRNAVGSTETVGWIAVHANAAAEQASGAKIMANEDVSKKMGEATGLFVIGSGHATIMTRVA